MIKFLLPLFILSLFLLPSIYASSNLEIAADSNFSNQTTDFSAGQTVYVKVSADNSGSSKHVLNLRDNQYSLLTSYDLASSGSNQFSTNFQAPASEGYYSLETQIESNGSKSTSVKTIKVGSPQNSNVSVKVNVQSRVEGQSVTVKDNTIPAEISNNAVSPSLSPSPSPSQKTEESPKTADSSLDQNTQKQNSDIFSNIRQFFIKIWQSIWPFK